MARNLLLSALLLSLGAAARAEPQLSVSSSSVRTERRFHIAGTADLYFGGGDAVPLPGLQLNANVTPHLAVEAKVDTLGFATAAFGGLKAYWFDHEVSPYVYGHAGIVHVAFLDEGTVTAIIDGGAGVEMTWSNGFTLFAEGGMVFTLDDPTPIGRTSIGCGYRF